ncbi:hypothetical protein [Deinococcus alpinitundrae]|uniref:hypothetical protein n=1 Tax=Deinococcus alpinitundrae TaxID=468913 RepID=UPI0013796C4F|nr:hypothetical protein [Deinococcus alpinitundrae]
MGALQLKKRLPYQSLSPKYRRADIYRRELLATLPASRYPLLRAYIALHGFLPDIAADTPKKRLRAAKATIQRIRWLASQYGSLSMWTLDLSELDNLDLYSVVLAAEAHATVRGWLATACLMGTWTVERGRDGRTHAHVVTSSAAIKGAGIRRTDVYDLDDFDYLAKPGDARLTRFLPEDLALWGLDALQRMKLDGLETYLTARAGIGLGRRLPRLRSDYVLRSPKTLPVNESVKESGTDKARSAVHSFLTSRRGVTITHSQLVQLAAESGNIKDRAALQAVRGVLKVLESDIQEARQLGRGKPRTYTYLPEQGGQRAS